jgi:GT2 family glycosyltransferase
VGGKLFYPDGRLQHAGIILGIGGVGGHSHKYFDGKDHGYFSRPHIIQNLSAVTAACCMVKRRVYQEVGGLDAENLQVAFNDVDFCLRLRERSYVNVYTPWCEAWHHESISRGYEDTGEKQERFRQEVLYMLERHGEALRYGDPYYNPNLTLEHENFSLSGEVMAKRARR